MTRTALFSLTTAHGTVVTVSTPLADTDELAQQLWQAHIDSYPAITLEKARLLLGNELPANVARMWNGMIRSRAFATKCTRCGTRTRYHCPHYEGFVFPASDLVNHVEDFAIAAHLTPGVGDGLVKLARELVRAILAEPATK